MAGHEISLFIGPPENLMYWLGDRRPRLQQRSSHRHLQKSDAPAPIATSGRQRPGKPLSSWASSPPPPIVLTVLLF